MNKTAIEIHGDALTGDVHVLILHIGVPIEVDLLMGGVVDHGVLSLILHGGFQSVFLLPIEGVETDRVVDSLIVVEDGQLQRVHLRGVGLMLQRRIACGTVGHGLLHLSLRLLSLAEDGHTIIGHHHNDSKKKKRYDRLAPHWDTKLLNK